MELWQAFLIALLGYSAANWSIPLMGNMGGWWTIGRPLVAGLVIGVILGDIKQGVILGAAIQALYIGLVTVGGVIPADINFAAYIGIPLALMSNASVETALAIAVPLSMLGVLVFNLTRVVNVYWVHLQERLINDGKLDLAAGVPIFGNLFQFIFRFFPIFFACLLGVEVMTKFIAAIPKELSAIITIFGAMLPIIGFTLILKMIVKSNLQFVFYVFGFILFTVFKVGVIPIVIVAAVFAYLDYKFGGQTT
jgi:mannose/fructose/N-acetylgalactosamine-specific phosphotransferase system component IIC